MGKLVGFFPHISFFLKALQLSWFFFQSKETEESAVFRQTFINLTGPFIPNKSFACSKKVMKTSCLNSLLTNFE